MKWEIRNTINYILDETLKLEDGVYITDINYSTMLSVDNKNGDNIFFYNIDRDDLYG